MPTRLWEAGRESRVHSRGEPSGFAGRPGVVALGQLIEDRDTHGAEVVEMANGLPPNSGYWLREGTHVMIDAGRIVLEGWLDGGARVGPPSS